VFFRRPGAIARATPCPTHSSLLSCRSFSGVLRIACIPLLRVPLLTTTAAQHTFRGFTHQSQAAASHLLSSSAPLFPRNHPPTCATRTAKYASAFYGPFRDALQSAPVAGQTGRYIPPHKKEYQVRRSSTGTGCGATPGTATAVAAAVAAASSGALQQQQHNAHNPPHHMVIYHLIEADL
jgi:hypothetical protein